MQDKQKQEGPQKPGEESLQFSMNDEYYSYEGSSQLEIPKKYSQLRKIQKGKAHQIWSINDKLIYVKYLEEYKRCFKDESARRRYRVFKGLSELLVDKSPQQCRRHHQTYQQRFCQNVDMIITYLKDKLALCLKRKSLISKIYKKQHKPRQSLQILETQAKQIWCTVEADNQTLFVQIKDMVIEKF